MHLQLQAFALVTLPVVTFALPHPTQTKESQNGLTFSLAARKALIADCRRSKKTLANRSGLEFGVAASPVADHFGYLAPIQVGSQTFNIKVDTSSEDL